MRKTILVVASVALAMVVLGGVAWAATIQCPGKRGTWITCNGTDRADRMLGNFGLNDMSGKKGGDTIYGRGNRDHLTGGPGSDKLYGGRDHDLLEGHEGSDKLYGGEDYDEFWSAHRYWGSDYSDDYIHGGKGPDQIHALTDNHGHDYTHSGVDRIYGDMGNDEIVVYGNAEAGDSAKEIVACGPGIDRVLFDEGVDVVDDTCEEKLPRDLVPR